MNPFVNPNSRSISLPDGCKDLGDVMGGIGTCMNFGAEQIDLREVKFTPELLRCIPSTTALMYHVLPIFDEPGSLGIALADVSNVDVIGELSFLLGKSNLTVRVADPRQIDEFIQQLYGEGET